MRPTSTLGKYKQIPGPREKWKSDNDANLYLGNALVIVVVTARATLAALGNDLANIDHEHQRERSKPNPCKNWNGGAPVLHVRSERRITLIRLRNICGKDESSNQPPNCAYTIEAALEDRAKTTQIASETQQDRQCEAQRERQAADGVRVVADGVVASVGQHACRNQHIVYDVVISQVQRRDHDNCNSNTNLDALKDDGDDCHDEPAAATHTCEVRDAGGP
mmetsp:Transcript_39153/g.116457  ORF Transcript_39153/g.116457 Transcript_39153/m.116457 type:complete len:221 (+) Transcript_39153:38-700(+)